MSKSRTATFLSCEMLSFAFRLTDIAQINLSINQINNEMESALHDICSLVGAYQRTYSFAVLTPSFPDTSHKVK